MTSRQYDSSQLNYGLYPRALDGTADLSVKLLSDHDFQDHQERMLTSESQGFVISAQSLPDTSLSMKSQQNTQLGSYFGTFYQAVMLLNFLIAEVCLVGLLTGKLKFEIYGLLVSGFTVAQSVMAFFGFRDRDLKKIEKALKLMMFSLISLFLYMSEKVHPQYEETGDFSFSTENFLRSMVVIGIHVVVNILPTRRLRKILKGEKASDGIEKLKSWRFMINMLMIAGAFCYIGYSLVSFIARTELYNVQSTFSKMKVDTSFLYNTIAAVLLAPLILQSLFLLFQGTRKQNLKNILRSLQLMKISLVFGVILDVLYYVVVRYEDQEGGIVGVGEFAYFEFLLGFACYFPFIYLACQVRDILKEHQKVKQT